MGGTNAPRRRRWQQQMRAGREGGWFEARQGVVERVEPAADGTLVSVVAGDAGTRKIGADYIVDCTGLEADIAEHRVLADLLAHGGAGRNPLGRLEVGPCGSGSRRPPATCSASARTRSSSRPTGSATARP
jgi:hypothetical protein